jgi:tRNA modification GTPase
LEVDLDLSEEGISVAPRGSILNDVVSISNKLSALLDSYRAGKLLRNGVSVAIVGKPNAGKSSLFNALLRENRSIVSHIPGTTRDFLEEEISISGFLFKLRDTAGLRTSQDPIEVEGVARAVKAMEDSDIVLLVIDSASPEGAEELIGKTENGRRDSQKLLVALNKCDMNSLEGFPVDLGGHVNIVHTSATTGAGLDELCRWLVQSVETERGSDVEITNERHREVIAGAQSALSSARGSLAEGAPYEFVALDLRGCIDKLSEITGETTSEDILNRIFSDFCVGK